MVVKFSKYEGAGNDFVVIDARDSEFNPPAEFIKSLCNRHTGIGADGLMLLEMALGSADFKMRYFNADGGEGTMCGNGGRCITLFAHYLGIGHREKLFEGIDGLHHSKLLSSDDNTGVVRLQMIDVKSVQTILKGYLLDTGSPHYVEFVDSVDSVDVFNTGRALRYNDVFSAIRGVNVNFVEVVGDGRIKVRTYERGVENETLACGTGATASAIATMIHTHSTCTSYKIYAPGGELKVEFTAESGIFTNVYLTGHARRVFDGRVETANFRL